PPPAALGCPWLILEEGRPRRQPASARPAPATTAVVQTRTPHGAGIAIGATAGGGGVPPRAGASPRLALPGVPPALPPHVRRFGAVTADRQAIAAWGRPCQVP